MEQLMSFHDNERRLRDAGLIAISIVILQVWISSGVHDVASLISLIAFSVSLPMLVFDLLNTHNSLFFTKIDRYLDDANSSNYEPPFKPIKTKRLYVISNVNMVTGMIGAVIGISTAIWHASWIAGLSFLIIGIISSFINDATSPNEEDLLKVASALGYKEGYDLAKEEDIIYD